MRRRRLFFYLPGLGFALLAGLAQAAMGLAEIPGTAGDGPVTVLAPLGLVRTDLVEAPLVGDCARGYLPADNPMLPGSDGPVDVTAIDVPFHRAGGGVVSTADEVARMLEALATTSISSVPIAFSSSPAAGNA